MKSIYDKYTHALLLNDVLDPVNVLCSNGRCYFLRLPHAVELTKIPQCKGGDDLAVIAVRLFKKTEFSDSSLESFANLIPQL